MGPSCFADCTDVNDMLQLKLTFLPLYGVLATGIFALVTRGIARWCGLFLIPIATLVLCFALARQIGKDGNLLFVALVGLFFLGMLPYYTALVGIKVYLELRNQRRLSLGSVCKKCGCDLLVSPGPTCPECGAGVKAPAPPFAVSPDKR